MLLSATVIGWYWGFGSVCVVTCNLNYEPCVSIPRGSCACCSIFSGPEAHFVRHVDRRRGTAPSSSHANLCIPVVLARVASRPWHQHHQQQHDFIGSRCKQRTAVTEDHVLPFSTAQCFASEVVSAYYWWLESHCGHIGGAEGQSSRGKVSLQLLQLGVYMRGSEIVAAVIEIGCSCVCIVVVVVVFVLVLQLIVPVLQ